MQETLGLRALLYARVSAPNQKRRRDATQDEPSVGQQFLEMEREARRRNWRIVGRYEDVLTGSVPVRDRPGGSSIYRSAEAGDFDVLMVYDNDRIGRDEDGVVAKVFRADMRFLTRQLFSVHQPVEPKRPEEYEPYEDDSALWLESVSDTASSVYIRQFRRRHAFGMRQRVEEKKLMPGKLPIGFTAERHVLPNGRALLGERREDPVFAPLIRRIYHEYEAGASAREIAIGLNAEGLRTPSGAYWTAGTLHGTLRNPVYYGAVVYFKHRSVGAPDPHHPRRRKEQDQPEEQWLVVEGAQHPALISKEQWERCQQIRRAKARYGRTFGESTLLSGLVECGHCGSSMNRSGGWSGGYFVCSLARKTGRRECQPNSIQVPKLEERVLHYLAELARDPQLLKELRLVAVPPQAKDPERFDRSLKAQLTEVERRLQKAREAYEAGVDSLAEYGTRKRELEEQQEALAKQQRRLQETHQVQERRLRVEEALPQLLAEFPVRFRQRALKLQKLLMRELLQRVVVTDGAVFLRFRDDWQSPSDYDRLMKIIHAYSEGGIEGQGMLPQEQ